MEVTVQSTLSTQPGRVTVSTSEDDVVDNLISAFCTSQGIRKQKDHVLRTRNHEILPSSSSISTAGISNRDVVFLGTKDDVAYREWQCSPWWLLAAVMLLLGVAGMAAIVVIKTIGTTYPTDHGVVLDAGSSHTQLYVYKWDAWKRKGTAIVEQMFTDRYNTPISSDNISASHAGQTLTGLLNKSLAYVPNSSTRNTPIFLGATAGMRLINAVNKTRSNEILSSVRSTVAKYPYQFSYPTSQARILTGQEEGSYGWVSVNFLKNSFGQFSDSAIKDQAASYLSSPQPRVTYGALDMGGASTQITFVPQINTTIPEKYAETLVMYGATYKVYTHSYLCYGLNEAMRRFKAQLIKEQTPNSTIVNPCAPLGNTTTESHAEIFQKPCVAGTGQYYGGHENITYTFVGSSNSILCMQKVQKLFNFTEKCSYTRCTFNGEYQPELHGSFVAFSGFCYAPDFLNLTTRHPGGNFSLEEYQTAVSNWCNNTWAQMAHFPDDPYLLLEYCFQGSYTLTLLKGYGFNASNWNQLDFKHKVRDVDLGWSLGLMLNASNMIPPEYPTNPVSTVMFVLLIILFVVFIVISVAFACHARQEAKNSAPRYQRLSSVNQNSYGAI